MKILPKVPAEELDQEYSTGRDCALDEEALDLESALD